MKPMMCEIFADEDAITRTEVKKKLKSWYQSLNCILHYGLKAVSSPQIEYSASFQTIYAKYH